jgi:hypothetical protein
VDFGAGHVTVALGPPQHRRAMIKFDLLASTGRGATTAAERTRGLAWVGSLYAGLSLELVLAAQYARLGF